MVQTILLASLVIIIIGISVLTLFLSTTNSCGIQHMVILNKIDLYEDSLDPEFCEVIVERIDSFNDTCEPEIEILDCS